MVILEKYARANGLSNLRYDQECSGRSTGDQATIEFEHWVEDAMVMLEEVARGPVILVASSLGCWISTIVAQRRPDRVKGNKTTTTTTTTSNVEIKFILNMLKMKFVNISRGITTFLCQLETQ